MYICDNCITTIGVAVHFHLQVCFSLCSCCGLFCGVWCQTANWKSGIVPKNIACCLECFVFISCVYYLHIILLLLMLITQFVVFVYRTCFTIHLHSTIKLTQRACVNSVGFGFIRFVFVVFVYHLLSRPRSLSVASFLFSLVLAHAQLSMSTQHVTTH